MAHPLIEWLVSRFAAETGVSREWVWDRIEARQAMPSVTAQDIEEISNGAVPAECWAHIEPVPRLRGKAPTRAPSSEPTVYVSGKGRHSKLYQWADEYGGLQKLADDLGYSPQMVRFWFAGYQGSEKRPINTPRAAAERIVELSQGKITLADFPRIGR